jgi:hypothetical protein
MQPGKGEIASENLPCPLFPKEGYKSSLLQREVRRDFIDQCCHHFEALNNILDSRL